MPTAQASSAARAVTPYSAPLGLGTTVQALPSQCRMPVSPTAQPSFAAAKARPLITPMLGTATSVQSVPSQCSISDWVLLTTPPAQISVLANPATELSAGMLGSWGLATRPHVPVQCSNKMPQP